MTMAQSIGSGGQKTILIVEDNPLNMKLFNDVLEGSGARGEIDHLIVQPGQAVGGDPNAFGDRGQIGRLENDVRRVPPVVAFTLEHPDREIRHRVSVVNAG